MPSCTREGPRLLHGGAGSSAGAAPSPGPVPTVGVTSSSSPWQLPLPLPGTPDLEGERRELALECPWCRSSGVTWLQRWFSSPSILSTAGRPLGRDRQDGRDLTAWEGCGSPGGAHREPPPTEGPCQAAAGGTGHPYISAPPQVLEPHVLESSLQRILCFQVSLAGGPAQTLGVGSWGLTGLCQGFPTVCPEPSCPPQSWHRK